MSTTHFRMRLVFLVVMLAAAVSALAGEASVFTPGLRRALQTLGRDGKTTLRGVSLREGKLDTIELEPVEVWAKDAKIVVFGAAGEQTVIPAPAVKYFQGRVQGEPDSVVFCSMSADGSIRGMILVGERRWHVGSGVRKSSRSRPKVDEAPVFMREADEIEELSEPGADWQCATDAAGIHPHLGARELTMRQKPVANAGNVTGATYQLRIAIETDNEFCAAFGNNDTAIATYIGDLVGKSSIVYQRDLKTTLVLGDTHIRSAGTDPWNVQPGANPNQSSTLPNALAEFGLYWHNNYSQASVPRSSAVFLSGKDFRGGKAWLGDPVSGYVPLCDDDFFCGADGSDCGSAVYANSYAGPYAFSGSAFGIETTVPDPEATQNGVQYGEPQTNFRMLKQFMHELGHNVNGPHTHCVALTAGEKTMYGVTRNFVDECGNFDGSPCFTGTASVPPEKGTIMSYCDLFFSAGYPQSRFLFGKAGEPSEKMLGLFHTAIEIVTPDPTITTQTEPVACSAGRTASVPSCSGCTYAWQISGGTLSGSTSNAITYTPSLPTVTLTATITTTRGCGITASKTITTSCAALQPPTNVVAAATSTTAVGVSWTAAGGATSYNVYRSTDGVTYALAGSTGTTSLNDGGRAVNTAYLYKVRSVNGGESADSNRDLATTVIFTDPTLTTGTSLRPAHITELRTAVDAVRTLAGLGARSYTDTTITATTPIKRLHVIDLRTALDAARSNLSLSALTYGESITVNVTTVKASHLNELRAGVQ